MKLRTGRRNPLVLYVQLAGFVVEHEELPVKSDKRGRKTYKRWALTGADAPAELHDLLDQLIGVASRGSPDGDLIRECGDQEVEDIRAEILRRFGRSS
jgi:hypothetical protein